jgi:hypothetical protein
VVFEIFLFKNILRLSSIEDPSEVNFISNFKPTEIFHFLVWMIYLWTHTHVVEAIQNVVEAIQNVVEVIQNAVEAIQNVMEAIQIVVEAIRSEQMQE